MRLGPGRLAAGDGGASQLERRSSDRRIRLTGRFGHQAERPETRRDGGDAGVDEGQERHIGRIPDRGASFGLEQAPVKIQKGQDLLPHELAARLAESGELSWSCPRVEVTRLRGAAAVRRRRPRPWKHRACAPPSRRAG